MTDQEALEAFLQSHEWEWQPGDMAYYKGSAIDESPFLMLNQSKESIHWWGIFRLDCKVSDVTLVNEHLFPWAGPWIEGRLLALLRGSTWKIEVEIGQIGTDVNVVCYGGLFSMGSQPGRKFNGHGLIQALIAALEAVEVKRD